MAPAEVDPVLARRRNIAHWTAIGKKVGYTALLLAIGLFVWGASTEFGDLTVSLFVVSMVVATAALVPAIIFGYAVAAATRDEARKATR